MKILIIYLKKHENKFKIKILCDKSCWRPICSHNGEKKLEYP